MQLDQNRIVIRERSYLDVLDLALRVIRVYALPLLLALAPGAAAAMALNAWLLEEEPYYDFDMAYFPFYASYTYRMLLLVILEIPLVTAPLTLFLGQALFTERPQPGQIVRGFLRALPQMLVYQVILRAILVLPVITWFLPFSVWPYLNEVILLERNPMWRGRRARMTTYRRIRALHGGYVGDLFAKWFASAALATLLVASIWISLAMAGMMLVGDGNWAEWLQDGYWEPSLYTVYLPLAIWLVAGFFAVVRFLAYLDLRIRREGWEVELMMRAEEARLTRQLA